MTDPRVLGCAPVDGVPVDTFVHQMGYMCVSHLVDKSSNI